MSAELVPGVTRPPRRDDYIPIVKAHLPCRKFADDELALRSGLLLMRDRAMATKREACELSWTLLDVVERAASDISLNRRVAVEDLRKFQQLCVSVVLAAQGFDNLYQPVLPLEQGEVQA